MVWNKRKLMIIYIWVLLLSFIVGGVTLPKSTETKIIIVCDNGTEEIITFEDLYICGGHKNPLRKNLIEINFTDIIKNYN